MTQNSFKKMLCVYFGKKFIDVKNFCVVTSFSYDTELGSLFPPKFFIVIFVCIYLRVFLKKRKEKKNRIALYY